MTGRAKSQAARQRRALGALGVARQRTPGPDPGTLAAGALPMLAVLEVLESAGNLARLGRAAAGPADDNRWRRALVCINAISQAVASDIRDASTEAVEALYLAVVNHQQRKEIE